MAHQSAPATSDNITAALIAVGVPAELIELQEQGTVAINGADTTPPPSYSSKIQSGVATATSR